MAGSPQSGERAAKPLLRGNQLPGTQARSSLYSLESISLLFTKPLLLQALTVALAHDVGLSERLPTFLPVGLSAFTRPSKPPRVSRSESTRLQAKLCEFVCTFWSLCFVRDEA